jgi:hypothetical protein
MTTNILFNNANLVTTVLVLICIVALMGSFWILRKTVVIERNTMLKDQKFAVENPDKIQKIKLVDRAEVYCVVNMENKPPAIIAYGVQAVRLFDQIISQNPALA